MICRGLSLRSLEWVRINGVPIYSIDAIIENVERNPDIEFAWDDRTGENVDHIAEHGLIPADWEALFHSAPDHDHDKEHSELWVAEGRLRGQLYRIVYNIFDGTVIYPILIFPITGFRILRRGLRHHK
jgi:hypothetical protein